MTNIPQDALGLCIFILLYSIFCWAASLLLVCMLWRYGERTSYVALISVFVTLSTTGSIIQQIYYAFDWSHMKEVEYQQAQELPSEPGRAYSILGPLWKIILYWSQFYCYDVLSLLSLFWTASLYYASRNTSFNLLAVTERRVSVGSKIFATIFPMIPVVVVNSKEVFRLPILWLILDYMIMVTSLTAGSVLLVLILVKYINTRRLTTKHIRRSGWWRPGSDTSLPSSNLESGTNLETNSPNSSHASIYDRALISRFSIAFLLLSLFEVAIIAFEISQKSSNDLLSTLPGPDFSLARTQADLVQFIPGVTAGLVSFVVFGTTKSFAQYKKMLLCIPKKRADRHSRRTLVRSESLRRVVPSPMLPSPEMVSPMTISPLNSPLPSPRNCGQSGMELSSLAYSPPSTNIAPPSELHLYPQKHWTIGLKEPQTGSQEALNPGRASIHKEIGELNAPNGLNPP